MINYCMFIIQKLLKIDKFRKTVHFLPFFEQFFVYSSSTLSKVDGKLVVANDADFATSDVVSTVTGTFAANSTIEFNRPTDADWSNCYYKFVLNVTVSSTSNKFVEIKGAAFTA